MEPSKTSGSIGVQQILPRTATGWQGQSAVPIQPTSQSSGDGSGNTPSEPERGATPDGVGKIVDKIA